MAKSLFYTRILSGDTVMFTLPRKLAFDEAKAEYDLRKAEIEFELAKYQKSAFEKYLKLRSTVNHRQGTVNAKKWMATPRKYMDSLRPEERESIMQARSSEEADATHHLILAQDALDDFLLRYDEDLALFNKSLEEAAAHYSQKAAEIEAAESHKRKKYRDAASRTPNPGYGYNYEQDPYDDAAGGFGYGRVMNPDYGYNYEEDPYDDAAGGFGYGRVMNPGHRHHRRGYGR